MPFRLSKKGSRVLAPCSLTVFPFLLLVVFQEELLAHEVVDHDEERRDELAEPFAQAQRRDTCPQKHLVESQADEAEHPEDEELLHGRLRFLALEHVSHAQGVVVDRGEYERY